MKKVGEEEPLTLGAEWSKQRGQEPVSQGFHLFLSAVLQLSPEHFKVTTWPEVHPSLTWDGRAPPGSLRILIFLPQPGSASTPEWGNGLVSGLVFLKLTFSPS